MSNEPITKLQEKYPQITTKILEYVYKAPKWKISNINPYEIANELCLDEETVIDWMLYSVYLGLFDMNWNTLCPYCGSIEHQHESLNHLETDFFCITCNVDIEGELDDKVEVAFIPKDIVRNTSFDPFENYENYSKYFFSNNLLLNPIKAELLAPFQGPFFIIEANSSKQVEIDIGQNDFRLISIDRHSQCFLKIDPNGVSNINVVAIDNGFEKNEVLVQAGKIKVNLQNQASTSIGIKIHRLFDEELMKKLGQHPTSFKRFLSGKEVLNRQLFRDLFPIQDLPSDLSLRIGDVTLLFTDLKGSTAMYEAKGDIEAYRLVKDHFEILTKAIRKHKGALIKTIGDAVMAAFSRPSDGLNAAIEMVAELNKYSKDSAQNVGLKLGLHKGAAIAVNANQSLDYFGRTVNIAARVQGEANSDEIWLSESMMSEKEIVELLNNNDYKYELQISQLRGIEGEMNLYKSIRVSS